jgi:hypothetical protein
MRAESEDLQYFDTPERSERLQLVSHLLRNVDDIVYLRGPDGAGKTTFAQRLLGELDAGFVIAWVDAGATRDLVESVNRQVGVAVDAASPWPDSLLFALGDRDLVLVVDNADALTADALAQVRQVRQRGGRVLMLGRGGPLATTDDGVQFIDLPGFDAAQSAAFLRSRPGAPAAAISDEVAAALHRAAQGMPGPLRDALAALGRPPPAPAAEAPPRPKPDRQSAGRMPRLPRLGRKRLGQQRLGWYALAGVGALVLATVLVFQDSINEALEPAPDLPRLAEREAPDLPAAGADARDEPEVAPLPLPPAEAPPGSPPLPAERAARETVPRAPADLVPPSLEPGSLDTERPDPLEAVMRDALAAARAEDTTAADATGPDSQSTAVTEPARAVVEPAQDVAPPAPRTSDETARATAPGQQADVPVTAAATAGARDREAAADEDRAPGPRAVQSGLGATGAAPAADPATAVVTAPVPAPVEDRTSPAAPAPAPANAATKPTPPPSVPAVVVDRTRPAARPAPAPAPAAPSPPQTGEAWLRTRPADHYTLQLVGARDRAAIDRFVARHGIEPPYAVFRSTLQGAPWYSLVAGDYRDRDAAIAARDRLPAGLRGTGVWPRTFASVRAASR